MSHVLVAQLCLAFAFQEFTFTSSIRMPLAWYFSVVVVGAAVAASVVRNHSLTHCGKQIMRNSINIIELNWKDMYVYVFIYVWHQVHVASRFNNKYPINMSSGWCWCRFGSHCCSVAFSIQFRWGTSCWNHWCSSHISVMSTCEHNVRLEHRINHDSNLLKSITHQSSTLILPTCLQSAFAGSFCIL